MGEVCNEMIDFHTHILPGIDDGARNIETSVEMLDRMKKQGVDTAVATPHFYADMMTVDGFLANRKRAYESVESHRKDGWPRIVLGAEVAFFPRISKADRVAELVFKSDDSEPNKANAVQQSSESNPLKVLLLEMPFRDWTKSEEAEVITLAHSGLYIILAHIERFMSPANEKAIERLLSEPNIKAQVNANTLTDRRMARRLLPMYTDGRAKFIGSDCHGVRHRPPNLPTGREALASALGAEFLAKLDKENEEFLRAIVGE